MTTRGKGEHEDLIPLIERRTSALDEEGRPLSQGALDRLLGWSRGTVAQLENGTMLPPDVDACEAIDGAFGLDKGTMWKDIAPYRLRRFDPQLAKWHDMEVRSATDLQLSSDERRLQHGIRSLDARIAERLVPVIEALGKASQPSRHVEVNLAGVRHGVGYGGRVGTIGPHGEEIWEDAPVKPEDVFAIFLDELRQLPPDAQVVMWQLFTATIGAHRTLSAGSTRGQ